jgi:hypothetical protein
LFNVNEGEAQEIINIAKNKKSFKDAAEFILENVEKRIINVEDNVDIKALLREIKEDFI